MRRKRPDASQLTEAGITPESLRPAPFDDESLPVKKRIAILEAWCEERDAWAARREAHADAFGWEGGHFARCEEERTLHPYPDFPFDFDAV